VTIANPWWWVALGAGVVAVVAAGVTLTVLARRRRARPPSAAERALARLAEAEKLAVAGQPAAYAAAASDAVREYIEARFGLPATHATTDEFLQELVEQPGSPLGEHRWPLAQFLSACDLAKFARLELPLGGMNALSELARQFIHATTQAPDGAGTATVDGAGANSGTLAARVS
jgi:nucleoid-associated protein YgaU